MCPLCAAPANGLVRNDCPVCEGHGFVRIGTVPGADPATVALAIAVRFRPVLAGGYPVDASAVVAVAELRAMGLVGDADPSINHPARLALVDESDIGTKDFTADVTPMADVIPEDLLAYARERRAARRDAR